VAERVARHGWPSVLREPGLLRRANVAGLLFALGLLLLGEACVRLLDLADSVAAPGDAAGALMRGLFDGTLSGEVATTLVTYVEGLALAVGIGVPLGIAIGSSRTVESASSVVVEFLRPIPAVALIPLAIFWFGLGTPMLRFLVAYAAVWPILVHTVYGVRGVDRMLYDVAATSGVTGAARIARVSVPAALPSVATGIRISAALALVVCVTAEYFVGTEGVGHYMKVHGAAYRLPELYAAAALTGLLGLAVDVAFRSGERRVLFWVGEARTRPR
jgi:NitT/TauT family transport system permease protein